MGNTSHNVRIHMPAALCALLGIILTLAACGGGGGSVTNTALDAPAFDTAGALAETTAASPVEGVDTELWGSLTAELTRAITARGASAAPPAGTQVTDLAVTVELNGTAEFTWTYVNTGDYDLNGLVNASDLTPIGVHYGATSADENWPAASIADGNGNGVIDLGDITPIGQHYGTHITAYSLQRSAEDGEDAAWSELATVPLGTLAPPDGGGMPVFSYTLEEEPPGGYASVVPVQGDGGALYTRSEWTDLITYIWGDYGRDVYRHCTIPYLGPENPTELWRLELTGSPVWTNLVIGPNGDLYTAGNTTLVSISPAGEINWQYESTGGSFDSRPVVTTDGIIHIVNDDSILEVDASGNVVSSVDSPFRDDIGWTEDVPVRGPSGNYYGFTSELDIIKVSPAGETLWAYTPSGDAQEVIQQFLFSPDYLYLLFGQSAAEFSDIQCMDYDGAVLWNYTISDEEYFELCYGIADDASRLYVSATEYFGPGADPMQALMAFDTSGDLRWQLQEADSHIGRPLGINPDGNLLLSDVGEIALTLDTDGNEMASSALTAENTLQPSDIWTIPELLAIDVAGNTYRAYPAYLDAQQESFAVCVASHTVLGELRWEMYFNDYGVLESSPCLGANGVLYFMANSGAVIAIGEDIDQTV